MPPFSTIPKVSVIVPVYDVSRYLKKCLDSIVNQLLTDIEIIIINDCSPDPLDDAICRQYADKDSRIIYVKHQTNLSLGGARNTGINISTGKYICFVDSDDMLPSDSLANMSDCLEHHHGDLAVGIIQSFTEHVEWIGVPVHQRYFTKLYTNTTIHKFPHLLGDISPCNKLYLLDFVKAHSLRFMENTPAEDIDFTARAYMFAKKICVLPTIVYLYRGRSGSITRRMDVSFFQEKVKVAIDLGHFFSELHALKYYEHLILHQIKRFCAGRFTRLVNENTYDIQIAVFDIIREVINLLPLEFVLDNTVFTSHEQIRILFLKHQEYDALIAFERNQYDLCFCSLLSNNQDLKGSLLSPALHLYQEHYEKRLPNNIPLNFFDLYKSKSISHKLKIFFNKFNLGPRRAFIRYLFLFPFVKFLNIFSNKDVWLIDERICQSAEDNSYFLFSYLRYNYPDLPVYYVISAGSPSIEKVKPLGNVLLHYSFSHAYYLLRATVLISTDSLRELAYSYAILPGLLKDTHNVFLQHGVLANKTTHYTKRLLPYFNQVIASSVREKGFFVDEYGYSEDEVSVTGIARFDNLIADDRQSQRHHILIMPTWRQWLDHASDITTSKFLWAWHDLIYNDSLIRLLDKFDIEATFVPHFKMSRYLTTFCTISSRINIVNSQDITLYEYIKDCVLFVTDYSSVMYDFLYQDKPVITYMFDKNEWEKQSPAPPHIDLDKDLPCDIKQTSAGVVESLEWYIEHDFLFKEEHRVKASKFFEYRDNRNCERIYNSIREQHKIKRSSKRFSPLIKKNT